MPRSPIKEIPLKHKRIGKGALPAGEVALREMAAEKTQAALRERVKELTCLYGVSRLAQQRDLPLDQLLQGIVALIPPAWQFPEIAHARLTFDDHVYESPGPQHGAQRQVAPIHVNGVLRGEVAVEYVAQVEEIYAEGAFLAEERNLIDGLAREIALVVERRKFDEDREKLQEQLRHSDRLATIGQLAAGVAHELNEPIGAILGFAQLILKDAALLDQTRSDVEKIVQGSLHAREVIRKLLLFARQTQPSKVQVDLNQIVEDGLYFLDSRCAKEGVAVVRDLQPGLPWLIADPSQLHQLLVNLIVNALHALPHGGQITIQTRLGEGEVVLAVEDDGTGMSEDVLRQLFNPFFTTKDVGQGTGLGLSVVHGIVTTHGGSIHVDSRLGEGSRFTVTLPLNRTEGAPHA